MPNDNDLVITPGGYKSRSNVFEIGQGQHIADKNKRLLMVESATGQVVQDLGAGNTQPLTGKPHLPDQLSFPQAPSIQASPGHKEGWVAYAVWTNTRHPAIDLFTATWTVPEPPIKEDQGQTIFLFIGMQNSEFILQPVLQWGESAAGGGAHWSICCWYTDGKKNSTVHTRLIPVDSGTLLKGRITLLQQQDRSFRYAATFEVQQEGEGQPQAPQELLLEKEDVIELLFANVALESYGVKDRNGYPRDPSTTIREINISVDSIPTAPSWQPVPDISISGIVTVKGSPFVKVPSIPGNMIELNFG